MPTAAATRSLPALVDGGLVDAGADGAGAGQHPGEGAVVVDKHRETASWLPSSRSNTSRGEVATGAVTKSVTATARSRANRSTSAQAASVTTPTGRSFSTTTIAPCARFVHQRDRVGDRVVRPERDRGVGDEVAALDERDGLGDGGDGQVLREHHQTTAARHRLGHPPARDRGHVRDDDRDGGAGPVDRAEIDVETRSHLGPVRDQEYVVVGQIVGRLLAGKKLHVGQ